MGLTMAAPQHGFLGDHLDNIGMGLTAEHYGVTKVYSVAQTANVVVFGKWYWPGGSVTVEPRQAPRVANYPPLGLTVFWLNSKLLGLPHDVARVELVCPKCAARQSLTMNLTANYEPTLCPRCRSAYMQYHVDPALVVNTVASRAIMSIPSLLAEAALAAGLFLLGQLLFGKKVGLIAAAVCWLFPPLAMDTSYWGQTDSWMLAVTVWFLYLMLRERWISAGLCIAVACLLKPQGVLLGPIAVFAALVLARSAGNVLQTAAIRLGKMAGAAVFGILILTLPWTLSSGMDWFQASYVANFKTYGETTLAAFNFWYMDALRVDAAQQAAIRARRPDLAKLESLCKTPNLKSDVELAGIAKDDWGKLLVLLALFGAAGLAWRYRSRPGLALVLLAGLWLWSSFMWPTRVHERYIVYAIPPMVLVAAVLPRFWPAVVALAIVGAAEMCHTNWMPVPPGQVGPAFAQQSAGMILSSRNASPEALQKAMDKTGNTYLAARNVSYSYEVLFTVLSLAGYAWAVAAAAWPCTTERAQAKTVLPKQ